MRKFAILILALAVSACIPPGRDYSWPQNDAAPTLDTDEAVLSSSPGDLPPATWKAQPVTPNATSVDGGIYIVQPGDTLRGIANKTGAGSQVIAAENDLVDPYHPTGAEAQDYRRTLSYG